MLCSLREGIEEDGFPPRCDWKLENTEPVITLPPPSPTEMSLASGKGKNTIHSVLVPMSISLGDCEHVADGACSAILCPCQHAYSRSYVNVRWKEGGGKEESRWEAGSGTEQGRDELEAKAPEANLGCG